MVILKVRIISSNFIALFFISISVKTDSLISGKGNTNWGAEFNFYMDAEAGYIVLNSLKCLITTVPLEIEDNIAFTLVP